MFTFSVENNEKSGILIPFNYVCDEHRLCDGCYRKLRKPSVCRTCQQKFPSRRQLFAHLLQQQYVWGGDHRKD